MSPFGMRRPDRDFADEIESHVALEADRLVREEGMHPDEARYAATRAFGNVVDHQERFYESVRWMWLDRWIRDIRYALRSLRRDLGLTIYATLILGLGIGATVTVFSVTNALLLRPLPFDDPDRLVWISNGEWGRGQALSNLTVQVNHLVDLRTLARSFTDVAGFHQFDRDGDHTLRMSGEAYRITRLRVTENLFSVLGVRPALGRPFAGEETQDGGPLAILLTHGAWVSRFAADSGVVGRAITIDDAPATVVGVLPASFDYGGMFDPGRRIDYVQPFPLSEETNRTGNTLALVGRLAPGATIEAAAAEATSLAGRSTSDRRNAFVPVLQPLHERVSGGFRAAMYLLTGAVTLVMLIVCANLANLLLARGATREKEVAVRAALGASRRRLVHQMLTESAVLTGLGTALGLLLAIAGTRLFADLGAGLPLVSGVRVDAAVLGITVAAATVTTFVLGLLPALRLSSVAFGETLKEGGRSASSGRRQGVVRNGLVVTEVALACVLLVGAGLLLRSFGKLTDVDLGFEPERAVTVRIDPSRRFESSEQRALYFAAALQGVRDAPGVHAAGLTDVLPMAFNRRWCVQGLEDRSLCPYVRVVSDGYLRAMGLLLTAGRDFDEADGPDARPVAIVNEAMAAALWPDASPLERTVSIYPVAPTVVGVVRGMRHVAVDQEAEPEIFMPMRQQSDYHAVHLIARSTDGPAGLAASVRAALTAFDPAIPVADVHVVQDIVSASVSPRRLVMLLLTGFAGFALVLASLGIYAVISYSVTQRRREMGIRIALGASPAELRTNVLRQTLRLAVLGVALGVAGAAALAGLLRSLLFGVAASDPITFMTAPLVLLGVALLAGYLPASRASRVNPTTALAQ